MQGDALNRSQIATVVCVPLTSNVKWATAPGNVLLAPGVTGLAKESVANVSQVVTLDKTDLTERTGKLSKAKLELVLAGIDVVLGDAVQAAVAGRLRGLTPSVDDFFVLSGFQGDGSRCSNTADPCTAKRAAHRRQPGADEERVRPERWVLIPVHRRQRDDAERHPCAILTSAAPQGRSATSTENPTVPVVSPWFSTCTST